MKSLPLNQFELTGSDPYNNSWEDPLVAKMQLIGKTTFDDNIICQKNFPDKHKIIYGSDSSYAIQFSCRCSPKCDNHVDPFWNHTGSWKDFDVDLSLIGSKNDMENLFRVRILWISNKIMMLEQWCMAIKDLYNRLWLFAVLPRAKSWFLDLCDWIQLIHCRVWSLSKFVLSKIRCGNFAIELINKLNQNLCKDPYNICLIDGIHGLNSNGTNNFVPIICACFSVEYVKYYCYVTTSIIECMSTWTILI